MNLIAIQMDMAWEDKIANFATVRRLMSATPIPPGSLAVLPELFATGFSMNVSRTADDSDRSIEKFLRETSAEFGVYLVAGMASRSAAGWGRNEAVVFDPRGERVARFRKLHPFSAAGEQDHYAPGNEIVTFAWSGFTAAPFVCYDLRFPEVFRLAVRRGADLLVVIANWPRPRHHHWRTLLAARAIENQSYVIGVNRIGRDPKAAYVGGSMILGPRGEILADAGDGETVIQAEPDLSALHAYRREFPTLTDMRSEHFPEK